MKTKLTLFLSLTLLGGVVCAQNSKDKIPLVPSGQFEVNPTVVQTGTYPTLFWNIMYPKSVSDVVNISPNGKLTLTTPMFVSVRPIGTGVTRSGVTDEQSNTYAEGRLSLNGGGYERIFYANNQQVRPEYSLYIKKVASGNTVDFGGRYNTGSGWSEWVSTKNSQRIAVLADGDKIPTTYNLYQSGKLAEYLKPYTNSDGTAKVGPMSVLVLMELGESSLSNANYDYQDLALLVSFAHKHPNNGHGNNIDGVDSSNPSNGSGGPNGAVDPSAGIDDEK